ncbi:MAG: peptide chain release factor 2 [Proteobacteria bacterium]|nr:peptide chain release factor 2 [Pseudomonadota bacterium]MDA1058171.1 peptide chain release factor 2 [Pseudomonadota bacterium]
MRAEFEKLQNDIEQAVGLLRRHLDYDNALVRLEELNRLSEDPKLWEDADAARKVMRERTQLDNAISRFQSLETEFKDTLELIELGEAEGDDAIVDEAGAALTALGTRAAKLEIETLLSGEADANNCFLEVHAGAGGTESQDWAEMLLRMYLRWIEASGYKVEWIEESPGEEAGIKSTTIRVIGVNAYGWLKTETGVHRLVRISPFDASARRHTSFASVGVYPEIDEEIDIVIEDKELRVDTYRASGAGGQHVNRTDSAVRLTHLPTGIVVQCQNDRSQHKNRSAAMKMLKSRLYEVEIERREAEKQALHDSKTDIGWGHQIRSYVLHPYQMVKDLRTGVERGNAAGVLDGDLDVFMAAALSARVGQT